MARFFTKVPKSIVIMCKNVFKCESKAIRVFLPFLFPCEARKHRKYGIYQLNFLILKILLINGLIHLGTEEDSGYQHHQ